jgi:hypothetical protein
MSKIGAQSMTAPAQTTQVLGFVSGELAGMDMVNVASF